MNFKSYNRLNNIIGWLVFAIAAFTYLSTMEHTVSLWDCGEFSSCAKRLEVPHPPGAPFHMMVYRMFALLAGNDIKMTPMFLNSASALCSAFTILFLFWSVTALALKFLVKDKENMDKSTVYAIMGAGIVGGLAYTFSDTFWFSAVESEVYAMSSMFTALIFWLVMKWEARSDQKNNLKWIVLTFYMIGVVIGVHLLGLLVIPTIFLVYYYKKYPVVTWKGLALALVVGIGALGVVQIVIIQWLPAIGAMFDRLFVNSFGAPYWSGVLFFYLLIFVISGYLIMWTHKNQKVLFNTAMLCFVSVIIGYSSYAICPIRSMADPAIDMNDTQDVYNFLGYLGRDQYGDMYLLSGPYYTAYTHNNQNDQIIKYVDDGQLYRTDRKAHEYVEAGHKKSLEVLNPHYKTLLPRMASQGDQYINGYKYWGNVKPQNEAHMSFFKNNMVYFMRYQINYMYFRYFFWNFVGRQNDIQGIVNEFYQGNWITGIPFIDNGILGRGPQKNMPYYLSANKAMNKLFALPLILGLLGMYYHYKKNKRDFFVIFVFFFMTGLAIEIYLNMPGPQPRERDYAFVGSFYVFAFWIGFGVLWLYEFLRKQLRNMSAPTIAIAASLISIVAVPTIMAAQEWDDHDRSKRMASLDYAIDYLESCAPHAVLFTNGDNDTYPLWYSQEVEGIRDDIRIVNLSLFGTDSYINQMRQAVNNAPALPFSLTTDQTIGWDYAPYGGDYASQYDQTNYIDFRKILAFIGSTDKSTKLPEEDGVRNPFMPTKKFKIVVDKQAAINSNTVRPDQVNQIADEMDIDIHKNYMFKSDIMLLDFITTNNWKYPIYFSITSGPDEYLSLGKYLQQEGLAYRLVPVKNPNPIAKGQDEKRVATDIMYNNVMTKFKWGNLDKGPVYMDYVLARQSENIRGMMMKLAQTLMNENRMDDAVKVADKCQVDIPEINVPYTYVYNVIPFVDLYYRAGQKDKAKKLGMHMADRYTDELKYYAEASKNKGLEQDLYTFGKIQQATTAINMLMQIAKEFNDTELINKVKPTADTYNAIFPQQNQQGGQQEEDQGVEAQ
jgi:hypothetical protein